MAVTGPGDVDEVSYAAVQRGDRNLSELIKLTKGHSVPEKTMIFTFLYNTQAAFYLPEYLVYCPFPLMFSDSEVPIEAQNVYVSFQHRTTPESYWIPTGFKIQPIPIPEGINTIIIWEKEVAGYYKDVVFPMEEIGLKNGNTKIFLIKMTSGVSIYYDYHNFTIR